MTSLRGRGQEPGSLESHSPDVQNVTNLLALEDLVYRGISLVQFVAIEVGVPPDFLIFFEDIP